jgi:hypothetical protein
VVIEEHVECSQKGIEVCLHKLTSIPFAMLQSSPRRRTAQTSDSIIWSASDLGDAPVHDLLTALHSTSEGKLYLFAVKDVYSGRIVGYSIDSRMSGSGRRGAVSRGPAA